VTVVDSGIKALEFLGIEGAAQRSMRLNVNASSPYPIPRSISVECKSHPSLMLHQSIPSGSFPMDRIGSGSNRIELINVGFGLLFFSWESSGEPHHHGLLHAGNERI
jgi:hypothetical protein